MEKGYILSILCAIATSCALPMGAKLLAKLGVGVAISETCLGVLISGKCYLDYSNSKIILTNTDEDNVKIIGRHIKEKSWS